MRPELLGTPLDAHFQTIPGGGGSIFPGAPITGWQFDDFHHGKVEIDDSTSFDASISAWAAVVGVQAGLGTSNDYRFASYRAWDVHFMSAVDDRYGHPSAPPGAVWYPARIYWGHAYEQVCFGASRSFTSSVAAKFKIFEGDVKSFAGANNLQCQLNGRGLAPTQPGAIFSGSDQEVRHNYTDGGPVAAIFVDYRLIPGVSPPAPGTIGWLTPLSVEVRFNAIHIDFQTNAWRVSYNAQGFCKLDGQDVPGTMQPAITGDEGTTGDSLSTAWAATLQASPGQRLSCGLMGSFRGTWKSGSLPTGTMQPDLAISGPGTFSGTFPGSNGDSRYTVSYTVTVRQQ
jgi:hypothetical protein